MLLLVIAACSDRKTTEPAGDVEQRRVAGPRPRIRAFPPYAIRSDAVGPYKLGVSVAALLDQLPSGPRINQFALPGVIRSDILRAEDDAIVIGVEPQRKATFIGVLRPEIARTDTGIHVGSTRAELERALGPPIDDPSRAHDPHLVIPTGLKNARILLDEERISAFVVVAESVLSDAVVTEPERTREASTDRRCVRPAGDREPHMFGICFLQGTGVARYDGDTLSLIMSNDQRPITTRAPGLVYAAALRNPRDGGDDLIVIAMEGAQSKTWSLIAYRLQGRKLAPTIQRTSLYVIEEANAGWIGADTRDIEVYLELTSRADSIDVGGLLTTRARNRPGDIVVLIPKSVDRRRARVVSHDARDTGTGTESPDATGGSADSGQ